METVPKKLRRTVGKLAQAGDEPLFIVPALLQRYCTERMLAMARIGGDPGKIGSYLAVTKKNLHLVRTGVLWDSVQSVPLESIKSIEYIDEFHSNTIELKINEGSERFIFYDDIDGIKFFKYIKFKEWEK